MNYHMSPLWLLPDEFRLRPCFKKAGSCTRLGGGSYSLRRDKKNPRLKYAAAGPLLQDISTFRMTSNGFLLISNRREIKISVVSLTRESGAKRRDFSWFIIV